MDPACPFGNTQSEVLHARLSKLIKHTCIRWVGQQSVYRPLNTSSGTSFPFPILITSFLTHHPCTRSSDWGTARSEGRSVLVEN